MTEQNRLVVCASHSPGMERDTDHVFGSEFRAGLADARALVTEFDPDFVILFGGDHRRAFRHVVPTFAVAMTASILPEGGHAEGTLDIPVDVARDLAAHLLDCEFDISICRDVGLDHAFAQPLRDLTGDLNAYPVIPVPINCATGPLPSAARVLSFGEAVGLSLIHI